ncbi:ParB N-terminal domain-containing protein [Actinomadura sp. DC4]|uniref:ParB/RepB/Spo0J family partition protein n=1 Tax=Actinomadura sp. DC4 TaxID=3055069 RepID=UPI0025B24118|nr:ParB N-terminal domain-containing protein [Actinomadura sp. DC4]MDN3353574.1 ParB N-terminal domain-containing protein [Actinomadura sp. DC4]
MVKLNSTAHTSLSRDNALARHLSLQQERIERSIIAKVPIASLLTTASPRLEGEDAEHIRTLADSGGTLPPIVVHLPSRTVIDGMHRLRAAMLRGEKDIEARFFHGSETDVFPLSVAANIQHGLPLSHKDRVAAAERIFVSHPEWSDRMVAIVVGLSGKKIAALRRQLAGDMPQPAVRIGRDGRSRPVDGTVGRERAARLIESDPNASLRQIARAAGISPATAADVRDRIRRGEAPIPVRRTAQPHRAAAPEQAEPLAKLIAEPTAIFERLRKDPSLRFSEVGRTLLRMFDACQAVVRDEEVIKKGLPPHCLALLSELSSAYATVLQSFATGLDQLQSGQPVETHESVGLRRPVIPPPPSRVAGRGPGSHRGAVRSGLRSARESC